MGNDMRDFAGVIGIDLGTTFSCIAVLLHDRVEVMPNDRGDRTTASCVAWHRGELLVGEPARRLAARGDAGAAFDAKRMIGCRFSDPAVQAHRTHWPFRVVAHDSDGEEIRVQVTDSQTGQTLMLAPEQISAEVLKYLKRCAEAHLGQSVRRAVITVPAYFNDQQRERTKAAATLAGLEVLRLVNEPTAAALAYGFYPPTPVPDVEGDEKEMPQTVLVFDFGGGTFDVSIIRIEGCVEVRATAGDTQLGGRDLDAALVEHLGDALRQGKSGTASLGGLSAAQEARLQAKLVVACEQAKRELSFVAQTVVTLEGAGQDGEDVVVPVTRTTCEALWAPLFERCFTILQRALSDAQLHPKQLDAVILVGGSSRIPKLAEELSRVLGPSVPLCRSLHPDEAVAMGAAVQGSILSTAPEQQSERTEAMLLLDVVPLSIGIDVDDGHMDVIVPRNTTIPYRTTKEYSTVQHHQEAVDIVIYEGERKLTQFNHKLGEFSLEGITPMKKGEPTIVVTFSIDADGLLTVTAEEQPLVAKSRKRSRSTEPPGVQAKSLTVRGDHRLSAEAIEKMRHEANLFARSDALTVAVDMAKRELREGFEELDRVVNAYAAASPTEPVPDKLQRRLKFVDHGKSWLRTRLPELKSEEEVRQKARRIAALQQKAIRVWRRAVRRRSAAHVKKTSESSEDDEEAETCGSDGDETR